MRAFDGPALAGPSIKEAIADSAALHAGGNSTMI